MRYWYLKGVVIGLDVRNGLLDVVDVVDVLKVSNGVRSSAST